MRIDMEIQPFGQERIMQRLQELQAQAPSGPAFSLPGGMSGLSGNLPGGAIGPVDPMAMGLTLTPDKAPANLRPIIEKAAGSYSIDPDLLDALVSAESSYDPNCRSRAGALGLTQLMPANLKSLGVSNWSDPEQNLMGGAQYLSQMMSKYGRTDLALAAYNAGPGAVDKYGGIPPYTETQNYVKKVLGLYEAKKAQR